MGSVWLEDLFSALILGGKVMNSISIVEIGMVGLIGSGSSPTEGSLSINSRNDGWLTNGSSKRLSGLMSSVASVTVLISCLSFPEKINLLFY